MIDTKRLRVFDGFIAELRTVWSTMSDVARRMSESRPLLDRLLADSSLYEHAKSWPSTDTPVSNLLLYTDPDYGFVINAVVRTAGRRGSAHDHAHAWVLYGVLDGTESLERYERRDDGSEPGRADVVLASVTTGGRGKVDLVAPFAIHAEQGGPTRSVAVIVRSEALVGRVLQSRFDLKAGTVTQGPGPVQIPFELTTDREESVRG